MIVAPPAGVDAARGLEALAESRKAEALAQARTDVDLIKRLMDRIKEDFFAIGAALLRLKDPLKVMALGYRSFHEMCSRELGISGSQADNLVSIATNMSAELARGVGQSNALALVTLCKATPEDDTPAGIVDAKIPLPSGGVLDVGKSSAREKLDAAKEIRRASDSGEKRGRSAAAKERAMAADVQRRLRAAGLERARVEAVATRAGQQADLSIDRVPMGAIGTLCEVLCGQPKARKGAR